MKTRLSFSSLKAFSKSPDHFLAYKNRQVKESPAMILGTAVHMAILEPEKFSETYDMALARKGTKSYNAQLEQGRKLLTQTDWEKVHQMQEKVLTHPMSAELLSQCTEFEKGLEGKIKGFDFRGFADGLCKDFILDLKTTKDASPVNFTRDFYNNAYHLQAAIYCELTGISDYWVIAVENTPPHAVTAYLVQSEFIDKGKEYLNELISKFDAWDGEGGGYDKETEFGFFELELPHWVK